MKTIIKIIIGVGAISGLYVLLKKFIGIDETKSSYPFYNDNGCYDETETEIV